MTVPTWTWRAALARVVLIAGCGGDDAMMVDPEVAALTELSTEITDIPLSAQAEGALLVTVLDGSVMTTTGPTASAIAATVGSRFEPSGCATPTVNGSTVTIAFASCTGPRGVGTVTGSLEIQVLGINGTTASIKATGVNIQVGGSTVSFVFDGAYASAGGQSIAPRGLTTGTGPGGQILAHTGTFSISWDANCASVDGRWADSSESPNATLDFEFSRCTIGCPMGTLGRMRVGETDLTILYDGTTTAHWATATHTGTFMLACTP